MDLTVVVLAGGRSTRFGADKALATFRGRRMVDRVAEAARPLAESVMISVREASPKYDVAGARRVVDRIPDAGPLSGLDAALRVMQTAWLLALACDMPLMTTDALRTLAAARWDGGSAVVARSPDGRIHPLCACYHRRILPRVAAHLRDGRRSLVSLIDGLGRVRCVELPAETLLNVNEASDPRVSYGD